MKKSLKILLPLTSVSMLTLPLLAVSCAETESKLLEKDLNSAREWMKNKEVTSASKLALNTAIAKAESEKIWADSDEKIKKIREEFNKNFAEIKTKNGQQAPKPEVPSTSEDKIVSELVNAFVIDNSHSQQAENTSSLLKKEIDLWYGRKDKNIIKTQAGKKPKWAEISEKDLVFKLSPEALSKIENMQLVNAKNPTWSKDGKTNLSANLDYEISVKKETMKGENKEVEFEITIKFKVATFKADGNHSISTKEGKAVISLSTTVSKDWQGGLTPKPEEPGSEEDSQVKAINEWAKSTSTKFKFSDSISSDESKKTSLKEELKSKKIDLYYDWKTHGIIKVSTGKHPNWKNMSNDDKIIVTTDKENFVPSNFKYQLMNPTDHTYDSGGKTKINAKIDYEVKEEAGKFKLILKYRGALFIINSKPKLGTEDINAELTL